MKYFEFKGDFDYYALIVSETIDQSLAEYEKSVDDSDHEFMLPDEISSEKALELVVNAKFDSESYKCELIKKIINGTFKCSEVVLIDGYFT